MTTPSPSLDFAALERPSPQLLTYYILAGFLTGPGMVFVIPALMIRYSTLRYRFEESGIRMQVGLLFRKEVVVAFRRIQDIHVSRNLIQRWLGISSVSIQTASGSALPEIVLEGMTDADSIRDWLYERMRGAKGQSSLNATGAQAIQTHQESQSDEVTLLLTAIRDNLAILANQRGQQSESGS
ncbi:MAG: PH domain-containing protein [Pirellula staleyi]